MPLLPRWAGRDSFSGQLLHAATYRNGAAVAGQDVLVVGAGNSGAEIAVDLAEHGAARVRLAVRTPPHMLEVAGMPTTLVSVLTRYVPSRIIDPPAV
jgi:putative flavoprotein involved in K+ transport